MPLIESSGEGASGNQPLEVGKPVGKKKKHPLLLLTFFLPWKLMP